MRRREVSHMGESAAIAMIGGLMSMMALIVAGCARLLE